MVVYEWMEAVIVVSNGGCHDYLSLSPSPSSRDKAIAHTILRRNFHPCALDTIVDRSMICIPVRSLVSFTLTNSSSSSNSNSNSNSNRHPNPNPPASNLGRESPWIPPVLPHPTQTRFCPFSCKQPNLILLTPEPSSTF